MKPMGEVLYELWVEAMPPFDGITRRVHAMAAVVSWPALTDEERAAWEHAAQTLLAEHGDS